MGVVLIPPNPAGPGSCRMLLEFDKDEAQAMIHRLKDMIERFRASGILLKGQKPALEVKLAPSSISATTATQDPPKQPMAQPQVPIPSAHLPLPLQASALAAAAAAPAPSPTPLAAPAPAQASQQAAMRPMPAIPIPYSYAQAPAPRQPRLQPAIPGAPLAVPSMLQHNAVPFVPPGPAVAAASAAAARVRDIPAAMPQAAMRPVIGQPQHPTQLHTPPIMAPMPPVGMQAASQPPQPPGFRPAAAAAAAAVVQPAMAPAAVPQAGVPMMQAPMASLGAGVPGAVLPRAFAPPPAMYPPGASSVTLSGAALAAAAAAAAAAATRPGAAAAAPPPPPTLSTAVTGVPSRPSAAAAARLGPAGPLPGRPTQKTAAVTGTPATPGARSSAMGPSVPRLVWGSCLVTDVADHNRDAVLALHYCPSLEGLPGGDGHGGWLISSSRRTLNLWECSAGGGRGMPSLMLLHSTETDFVSTHMAVEASSRLLFAASADHRTGAESVTVHSLDPEAGMLSFRYRMAVVNPNTQRPTPAPGAQPPPRMLSRVASLNAFGGGLRNTCAAAYQGVVMVFDAPGLFAPPGASAQGLPPKGSWKAHENVAITALGTSLLGGARMITGTRDGTVVIWDMRVRPPGNSWRCRGHQQSVTGVHLANETMLVTSSLDGKVHIWDLRSTGGPRSTATPDGSAVLGLKLSPVGDCAAVNTVRGLLTVDMLDRGGSVSSVTTTPLPRPYADIVWNTSTTEIYAATATGSITVYRQSYS